MTEINRFLVGNGLRISANPCVSPDFCLDWESLAGRIGQGGAGLVRHPKSVFRTAAGEWSLVEDAETGDCAWRLERGGGGGAALSGGIRAGAEFFPASWENLLALKNLVQEFDPSSTLFPSAAAPLGTSTLGIGARFTTLHWPAVEWAMSALDLPLTANQNSIPRELVYDVGAMLGDRLDTVPFPFIGTRVPEGHQGQSVKGMSHGAVLSKLRTGFHHRRIPWSFNADHQPVGGSFDAREDALVEGCLLASYITFDLSPELALGRPAADSDVDPGVREAVRDRVRSAGLALEDGPFMELLRAVWPAIRKMRARDLKYRAARERAFTTGAGRAYMRELSIDELPGLTSPATTAVMLALCEALGMPVSFIAPAFGFQKNMPYPDNGALEDLVSRQWAVARAFGASIGFHSGSGKSAENYAVMGRVTGGRLEIKTSGRYTYEMGVALHRSPDAGDQALWRDWYRFTLELALLGAFSDDPTESRMARSFILDALVRAGGAAGAFESRDACRRALEGLEPSPDSMFFFEYNFLFVLAAGGRAEKAALGDHSPAGYAQRARFYSVSPAARLAYSRGVASYVIFLARHTGLVSAERCDAASALLGRLGTYEAFLDSISR